MALLSPAVRTQISQKFVPMQDPVHILVFSDGSEEGLMLQNLAGELAEISDKVQVQDMTGAPAQQFGVEHVPALAFRDGQGRDRGIRYYGVPAGYEFTVLIEDIIDLSTGKTQLSARTRERLQSIQDQTVIKVFVTPT